MFLTLTLTLTLTPTLTLTLTEGGGEPRREDGLEVRVHVEVVHHGADVAAARGAARAGRTGVAQHVARARRAQRGGEGLEASPGEG